MIKSLFAAVLLGLSATSAQAAVITYTITGTFSGFTRGGTFQNVNAIFTGIGNTSTATNGTFGIPSYTSVPLSTATAFTPGDSLTYNITSPGTFGIYKASDLVPGNTQTRLGFIFNNDGSNGIAIESNDFNGYSGLTSFAATVGNVYYQNATFNTDLGQVNITGFTNGTFAANVVGVPEPASWALMISGFGLVGGALRSANGRRRATTVVYA